MTKTDLGASPTAKEAAAKSKKVFKEADITQKQISEMQKALKADFEAADTHWVKWTKVP